MSCRCRDIRRCRRDIYKLNNIINRFGRMVHRGNNMLDESRMEWGHESASYELKGVSRGNIENSFQKYIRYCENSGLYYSSFLNRKVDRLYDELRYMEYEDEDYHDDD